MLARALSLVPFFVLIKGYLIGWYLWNHGVNPTGPLSSTGLLLLWALDLAVVGAVAYLYLGVHWFVQAIFRPSTGAFVGIITALTHTAIIGFSIASMRVSQIYGVPLDVEHIRSADQLTVMQTSITAYVDGPVIVLLLAGLGCYGAFSPFFARWLALFCTRRQRLAVWAGVGVAAAVFAVGTSKLQAVYAYGLNWNALSYFVRTYRPAPDPSNTAAIIAALKGASGDTDDALWRQTSLHAGDSVKTGGFPEFSGATHGFNVLLILLESTGARHLDGVTTPNIMRLAQQGLSFTNYFTTASHSFFAAYSIFYSDYLGPLGAHPSSVYRGPMPHPALPEVFAYASYETAVFQSGYLSYTDFAYLWEAKGVDTVVGAKEINSARGFTGWPYGALEEHTVEALMSWIGEKGSQKFFATYRPVLPHHPYDSPLNPPPFPQDSWRNRHRNALYYVDMQVGRLLDFLARSQLLDHTLVVLVADHGETVSTYPVGHGLRISDEEIHVPLIFSNPRLFTRPHTSARYANHLDFAPTLTALAGLAPATRWRGRDLLQSDVPSRILYFIENHSRMQGLIDQGLLFTLRPVGSIAHLYCIGDGENRVMPKCRPSYAPADRYRSMSKAFQHWAIYHHLEASQLTRCPPPGQANRKIIRVQN